MSTWQWIGVAVALTLLIALFMFGQVAYLMWKEKQEQKRMRQELIDHGILAPGDTREITIGELQKLYEEGRQRRTTGRGGRR